MYVPYAVPRDHRRLHVRAGKGTDSTIGCQQSNPMLLSSSKFINQPALPWPPCLCLLASPSHSDTLFESRVSTLAQHSSWLGCLRTGQAYTLDSAPIRPLPRPHPQERGPKQEETAFWFESKPPPCGQKYASYSDSTHHPSISSLAVGKSISRSTVRGTRVPGNWICGNRIRPPPNRIPSHHFPGEPGSGRVHLTEPKPVSLLTWAERAS
jgi:hypothetical protein